jgi:hypothetical protein
MSRFQRFVPVRQFSPSALPQAITFRAVGAFIETLCRREILGVLGYD